jgi:hypothetical protein
MSLTSGLDPESPEYLGALTEEHFNRGSDLRNALFKYIEETEHNFPDASGYAAPRDRVGLEDIERRFAAYHEHSELRDFESWERDDVQLALDVLAPAQRFDLFERIPRPDLTRAGQDTAAAEHRRAGRLMESLYAYLDETKRLAGEGVQDPAHPAVLTEDLEKRLAKARGSYRDISQWTINDLDGVFGTHAPQQRADLLRGLERALETDHNGTRLSAVTPIENSKRISNAAAPLGADPELTDQARKQSNAALRALEHAPPRSRSFATRTPRAKLQSLVAQAHSQVALTAAACKADRQRCKTAGLRAGKHSPRDEDLRSLTAPVYGPVLTREQNAAMSALNMALTAMRTELQNNPLWIAATRVERSAKPLAVDDLLARDPMLIASKAALSKCQAEVTKARHDVAQWTAQPTWLRKFDSVLLGGQAMVREALVHSERELSSQRALTAAVERDRRAACEAALPEANRRVMEQLEHARATRQRLEGPLHETFMLRSIAQDHIAPGLDVAPLREAPVGALLEYTGTTHHEPRFCDFRSGTTAYRALASSIPFSPGQQPVAGDVLRLGADGRLEPVQRATTLTIANAGIHEGTVGATHTANDKILEFQLIDASGRTRWVKSSRGDDLTQELRGDVAAALISGNHIRIQNREVHILSRARSSGLER